MLDTHRIGRISHANAGRQCCANAARQCWTPTELAPKWPLSAPVGWVSRIELGGCPELNRGSSWARQYWTPTNLTPNGGVGPVRVGVRHFPPFPRHFPSRLHAPDMRQPAVLRSSEQPHVVARPILHQRLLWQRRCSTVGQHHLLAAFCMNDRLADHLSHSGNRENHQSADLLLPPPFTRL
jgi:hypothetical protein